MEDILTIIKLEAQIEKLREELGEANKDRYTQKEHLDCVVDFVNQTYLKDSEYQIKGFDYKIIRGIYGPISKPIPVFYKKKEDNI